MVCLDAERSQVARGLACGCEPWPPAWARRALVQLAFARVFPLNLSLCRHDEVGIARFRQEAASATGLQPPEQDFWPRVHLPEDRKPSWEEWEGAVKNQRAAVDR